LKRRTQRGSTSGITLPIKRVNKSKIEEKAKPKRRAGPR